MPAQTPPIDEHDLCAAWVALQPSGQLYTTDGRRLDIVHRGAWTHGFGPDFHSAMICLDGVELRTGSVELHLRTRGWTDHGHHLDPRYNSVVLHVVAEHDWVHTTRQDGVEVPVLHLATRPDAAGGTRAVDVWSLVGGAVCAEGLTRRDPQRARDILRALGDVRLSGRVARIEASLHRLTPADALVELLLDALGYSANRGPMGALADHLAACQGLDRLARTATADRLPTALAVLLGLSGLLPLSPTEAHLAGLSAIEIVAVERRWDEVLGWSGRPATALAWQTARVRPANHPLVRLIQAAAILAAIADEPVSSMLRLLDIPDTADASLRALSAHGASPPLGPERARAILGNVVVPFALALARTTGDTTLEERAVTAWDRLPSAERNVKVRDAMRQVAGDAPIPRLGVRGQQGLIHLHDTLCHPRRCFECPIAEWVMDERPSLPPM